MVEFAVTAPVLVLFGLGVGEFGNALQNYHVRDKGMRDAARYLARAPTTCNGGTGSITNASDVTAAKNLAIYGNKAGSGNPVLSFWSDPNTIGVAVACYDDSGGAFLSPNGSTRIPIVTATATVPYTAVGFLGVFGLTSPTFVIQHQELTIPE